MLLPRLLASSAEGKSGQDSAEQVSIRPKQLPVYYWFIDQLRPAEDLGSLIAASQRTYEKVATRFINVGGGKSENVIACS